MSRNILLAGGCSYTDPHFNESHIVSGLDCSFPKWPELLAEQTNLQVVNVGQSGAGNGEISNTLSQYIIEHHERIQLVCVLWSEWQRFSLFFNCPTSSFYFMPLSLNDNPPDEQSGKDVSINQDMHDVWKRIQSRKNLTEGENHPLSRRNYIFYHILMYKNLETLCRSYGIEYKCMQGTRAFGHGFFHPWLTHHDIRVQDTDYFLFNKWDLEIDNFIGWPLLPLQSKELPNPNKSLVAAGFDLDLYIEENEMYLHKRDMHPNKEGHEFIANLFKQHL